MEAELEGQMLYITNEDRPGFIGALGTLLGEAGINIATFHLGRVRAGGDAIALVAIDGTLQTQVMNRLRALPHIKQADLLVF